MSNAAFAEATTGVAFALQLSKRQCNTLLRQRAHEAIHGKPDRTTALERIKEEGPASISVVQADNYISLRLRGLVAWHWDEEKKCFSGFLGLTRAGELTADLLAEAGLTIENTNTLSVLRRLEREKTR